VHSGGDDDSYYNLRQKYLAKTGGGAWREYEF
jgi:hypothetical protein